VPAQGHARRSGRLLIPRRSPVAGLAAAARRSYTFRVSSADAYTGGCHCGAVRFHARVDLGKPVMSCNCSMCGRAGTLLTFIPVADFTLLSGEDTLTDYLFNKHIIHHTFCRVCGIKSFARGKNAHGDDMIAVNARCLDGVDVQKLDVSFHNGRDTRSSS
jgi:hypothetical protein